MADPLLSVVMSVYNAGDYLFQAIESILEQRFEDFEFIIVNDGSTDKSGAILDHYRQLDKRIRILEQENKGLIASLNRGCQAARGAYIARMDADDISLPNRFVQQIEFMRSRPEVGVLGTGVYLIDEAGNLLQIRDYPSKHFFIKWQLCFNHAIAHPTVMIKRELIEKIGGYDSKMLHVEDYDLWRRLSRASIMANLPDALHLLRRHESCVSRVHCEQQAETSIKISQLMIEEVLGHDVSREVVKELWKKKFLNPQYTHAVSALIFSLFYKLTADNQLTLPEKRLIRKDAAERLLNLARGQSINEESLKVLRGSLRLDPLIIVRLLARRYYRRFRFFWLKRKF